MPIEREGQVFFGTKDGYVYALKAASGAVVWRYRVSVGLVNTVAAVSGNRIIATAMDGRVICLSVD